jgi:hypothetical protein
MLFHRPLETAQALRGDIWDDDAQRSLSGADVLVPETEYPVRRRGAANGLRSAVTRGAGAGAGRDVRAGRRRAAQHPPMS